MIDTVLIPSTKVDTRTNIHYVDTMFHEIYNDIVNNECEHWGSAILFLFSYADKMNSPFLHEKAISGTELAINELINSEHFLDYWRGAPGSLMAIDILIKHKLLDQSIRKDIFPIENSLIEKMHNTDVGILQIPFTGSLLLHKYSYRKHRNIYRNDLNLCLILLLDTLLIKRKRMDSDFYDQAITTFITGCKREAILPEIISQNSFRKEKKEAYKPHSGEDYILLINSLITKGHLKSDMPHKELKEIFASKTADDSSFYLDQNKDKAILPLLMMYSNDKRSNLFKKYYLLK